MLVIYLCNINFAANITTVSWMSAIKKDSKNDDRTCSKGMFNDFFGQWNAHVHCWCNTNKRIRNLTTQCCVSIPSSISSFWTSTKNSKWSRTKCLECHAKNWPVGGEPALATKKKKKKWVNLHCLHFSMSMCYALFHSYTLGTWVSI